MEGCRFDPRTGIFFVSGEFTIYQVQSARMRLLEANDTGALRVVDLSAVTEFDSAALQLLLSLRGRAAIHGQNERVNAVMELLNLRQILPLSAEVQA